MEENVIGMERGERLREKKKFGRKIDMLIILFIVLAYLITR
jgi:hypothetical protein